LGAAARVGPPQGHFADVVILDVRDVAQLLIKLMNLSTLPNERFILSSENLLHREVLTLIADGLGVRTPHKPINYQLAMPLARLAGFGSRFLGNEPRLSTELLRSTTTLRHYDSSKIRTLVPHNYIPIPNSLLTATEAYKSKS